MHLFLFATSQKSVRVFSKFEIAALEGHRSPQTGRLGRNAARKPPSESQPAPTGLDRPQRRVQSRKPLRKPTLCKNSVKSGKPVGQMNAVVRVEFVVELSSGHTCMPTYFFLRGSVFGVCHQATVRSRSATSHKRGRRSCTPAEIVRQW